MYLIASFSLGFKRKSMRVFFSYVDSLVEFF